MRTRRVVDDAEFDDAIEVIYISAGGGSGGWMLFEGWLDLEGPKISIALHH